MAQWYRIGLECRRCRRHGFDPWVGKIPWKRKLQHTSVFLPEESHGQRSLLGYHPWDLKSVGHNWARTQLVIQRNADTEIHFEGEFPLLSNTSIWKGKSLSRVQLLVTPRTIQSMEFSRKNTGVGRLFLLQRIFPTQGSNPQGRSLREEILNTLQDSCQGYPTNRGAWRATGHRVAKSGTQLNWLSMHACIFVINVIKDV